MLTYLIIINLPPGDGKPIHYKTVHNTSATFHQLNDIKKMGEYKYQVMAMLSGMESSLPSDMVVVNKCPNPPREIFLNERKVRRLFDRKLLYRITYELRSKKVFN